MHITDNNGTDITAELAPVKEIAPAAAQPLNTQASDAAAVAMVETTPIDPTFAALHARHGQSADVAPATAPKTAQVVTPPYEPTPGEVSLHEAIGMVAQHVENLYKQTNDLNTRLKALEDDNGEDNANDNN